MSHTPSWTNGWLTPQQPQRQDSLDEQLRDVAGIANLMGCYDAADWIRAAVGRPRPVAFEHPRFPPRV